MIKDEYSIICNKFCTGTKNGSRHKEITKTAFQPNITGRFIL
jgi:hypothetical protein